MIMGPTASGKTALAIAAAQRFDGEIISVDSALIYQGMDIGTAKPSAEELAAAPHHLIDICQPTQSYSAAQFCADAKALIAAIQQRGRLPILAGGTMLYYRALLSGIAEMPAANAEIRAELEQQLHSRGAEALHKELAAVDASSAARIHVNDPQRLLRALEVYRISGQPLSHFHARQREADFPWPHVKLALLPEPRERHRQQVAARFDQMLEQGLVAEVKRLYARGDLHAELPAMRSVGYRQVWQYLQGELSYAEMRERAIIATRQLAKRQMTWLRKEPQLQVWNCFDLVQSDCLDSIADFLQAVQRSPEKP